jgi:TPR repeat protein
MEFEDAKVLIDRFLLTSSNDDYDETMDFLKSYTNSEETRSKFYEYFESLADTNSNAIHLMAVLDSLNSHYYKRTPNYDRAHELHKKASKLNNIYSSYDLAQWYSTVEESINYYKIAANGGMAKAQYELGYIYGNNLDDDGNDNKNKNIEEAIKWYEMALVSNHIYAPSALGALYKEHDIMKSVEYYKIGIEKNDHWSKDTFDKILKENKNYATITDQANKIKELESRIEELELMPGGPKYKEAMDHFNLLAKISE